VEDGKVISRGFKIFAETKDTSMEEVGHNGSFTSMSNDYSRALDDYSRALGLE